MEGVYYLLSVYYNRKTGKANLKFYSQSDRKIKIIEDWSNHKPYCISDASIPKLKEALKPMGKDLVGLEKIYP